MEKGYKIRALFKGEDMKVIHASIEKCNRYSKHSDKAKCTVISCDNAEGCSLYKEGKCELLRSSFWTRTVCPHGNVSRENGFTRRALKYHDWIRKREELYKDNLDVLTGGPKKIFDTGEYIGFPYVNFMDSDDKTAVPFITKDSRILPYIKKEDFTIETIACILALKGKLYYSTDRDEINKKLCRHLKEIFPDKFRECVDAGICVEELDNKASNVGRIAYLHTLKAGVELERNWIWDGIDSIASKSSEPLWSISRVNTKAMTDISLKIKIDKTVTVEIKDEKFVTNDTIFVD